MTFLSNRPTGTLILVMIVLVSIGILISKYYYHSTNRSIDPRVIEARELYAKYDDYAHANDSEALLLLLDSIELIYSGVRHYHDSYEIGVLNNNRTAIFLTAALNRLENRDVPEIFQSVGPDSLLILANGTVKKSIDIYEDWTDTFGDKTEVEIEQMIRSDFLQGLEQYPEKEQRRFLRKRIGELVSAQQETSRRLSVSYTNLGVICRHREEYATAAEYYKKALDLWDENLSAKNNLNVLLGRPMEKRNFFQKLFPPDRNN